MDPVSAPPDPRKDPRFRRFRGAAYGVHITLSTLFSLWMIWNVGHSVAAMTPGRPPAVTPPLTVRECLDAADGHWKDLEAEREKLVHVLPARKVDQEWMRYRSEWLTRLRKSESECALDSRDPARVELRAVYRQLAKVQDLYTIHAVQYAGEVGGAVDALHAAFDSARRDAGRLP
ncbi:hypothetical protein D7V97_30090 [Corallococcus sp. CA053C]|uniref:hypothetical protein n=1 Tax=Corallococcus sp. CA053C TaxID=2316732 RepID=UPI000EA193B0|nr:hypothetical protein [Corallococcus sp. CA053C]RKH00590.1 hypothetical protein D7V97_30090 [Corallococcus sp. CA053C]